MVSPQKTAKDGGPRRARVWVGRVSDYDVGAVREAVARGLEFVAPTLRGNVVAKANWLISHPRLATASSTRPELAAGALEALFARQKELRVVFSGSAALGCSTRHQALRARGKDSRFKSGGYFNLERIFRGRVTVRPTDESRFYRYQLSVGRRMNNEQRRALGVELDDEIRYWDRVVAGYELYHADSVVLMPKLKTSVLAGGLSGAVDLQGVGFLRGLDRADGHNRHNARRMVDMLEITDPDLVITDAIELGFGGSTMTQSGHRLGLVVIADNAVAHDAVCSRLLGLDPEANEQLRLANSRGFGPIDAQLIDLGGDADQETSRKRIRGFGSTGLRRVDEFGDFFARYCGARFPFEVLCGGVYESPAGPGVFLDWLYTSFDHPKFRERMKWWPECSILIGDVVQRPRHSRVYLIGDRAIESFRETTDFMQPALMLPLSARRHLPRSLGLYRYRLKGGGRGWATSVSGNPPSRQAISWALFLGTFGRVRAPLLAALPLPVEAFHQVVAAVLRHRRNRRGLRVVHARKIERMLHRSWRKKFGLPAALTPKLGKERGP
jgi:uncharacterized protein (DUF362 family)